MVMNKPYIIRNNMGICRVCGRHDDLRCQVCFDCSSKVKGARTTTGHMLWERSNPRNSWHVNNLGEPHVRGHCRCYGAAVGGEAIGHH